MNGELQSDILMFLVVGGLALTVGGIYSAITKFRTDSGENTKRGEELTQNKYSEKMGRFAARRETKAATSRSELLLQLATELQNLGQLTAAQTDNLRQEWARMMLPFELQRGYELAMQSHFTQMSQLKATESAADKAAILGLDMPTYLYLQEQATVAKVGFESRRLDMELTVEQQARLKSIDAGFERDLAELDKEMAMFKVTLPFQEYAALSEQLSKVNRESAKIANQSWTQGYKQQEVNRLKREADLIKNKMKEYEAKYGKGKKKVVSDYNNH